MTPGSDATAWVDDGRLSLIDAIREDIRIAGRRGWYVVDLAYQNDPADEDVDVVSLDLGKPAGFVASVPTKGFADGFDAMLSNHPAGSASSQDSRRALVGSAPRPA